MGKNRTYFPNYQVRRGSDPARANDIQFSYAESFFVTRMPFFGATETQKATLEWAASNLTPPVICINHGAVEGSKREAFRDPKELHRTYYPYAEAVATFMCLGEETSRRIRIYFCNVTLHEDGFNVHTHTKSKGVYVIPLEP